jgi:hypothetical protein
MGFPTRETNSSHASSSHAFAQRQTMSFRDKDEYRFGLGVFDMIAVQDQTAGRQRQGKCNDGNEA